MLVPFVLPPPPFPFLVTLIRQSLEANNCTGWSNLFPGDASQTIASHRSSVDGPIHWGTQKARSRDLEGHLCVHACVSGTALLEQSVRVGLGLAFPPYTESNKQDTALATPRSCCAEYQRWEYPNICYAVHCARQIACTSGSRMMPAHCKAVNKHLRLRFQAHMRHTCPLTYCKMPLDDCNIGGCSLGAHYLTGACSCGSVTHCVMLSSLTWRLQHAHQAVTPVAAWLSIYPLSLKRIDQNSWPASEMGTYKAGMGFMFRSSGFDQKYRHVDESAMHQARKALFHSKRWAQVVCPDHVRSILTVCSTCTGIITLHPKLWRVVEGIPCVLACPPCFGAVIDAEDVRRAHAQQGCVSTEARRRGVRPQPWSRGQIPRYLPHRLQEVMGTMEWTSDTSCAGTTKCTAGWPTATPASMAQADGTSRSFSRRPPSTNTNHDSSGRACHGWSRQRDVAQPMGTW